MNQAAASWIRRLGLRPHPEGGYYRETYRARWRLPAACLPRRFGGARVLATLIYFLLTGREVSRLHRLRADELWHFYAGGALDIHLLTARGQYRRLRLGPAAERGAARQVVIPAGCWFGAGVVNPRSYSLLGCTVTPGFEFADFEPAGRRALLARYPRHAAVIRRLT